MRYVILQKELEVKLLGPFLLPSTLMLPKFKPLLTHPSFSDAVCVEEKDEKLVFRKPLIVLPLCKHWTVKTNAGNKT